ncbi:putative SnRNP Sm-like protein [Giardia duodenalis]|uniref:SnRNP Sm-like protein n=1 Tax=Giardia intestinalis (strain ATCC 50803 / WB clone C6) TaxID=184922 RepID=A8B9F2_GIAIC|nr:putative SnRNP Sm-like protein [Giardia intestinalis]KAE8306131.1 putative SnRNP Sm-like protein [Giardia intestinalis]|eukprot:XP_001708472.1 SnRNP Sm-like protein, putative [Giardia lamblia ATCC 50803]
MQLIRLVQKLQGQRVRFELKAGGMIEGTVALVDATFVVHLSQASYTPRGATTAICHPFVVLRGAAICSLSLPGTFDTDTHLCALRTEYNRGPKNR